MFAKSSMRDIDGDYKGRPFGGVAVICRNLPKFTYHIEDISCDRLLAVKMCDTSGTVLQTVVCVYMPYFDHSYKALTEEF